MTDSKNAETVIGPSVKLEGTFEGEKNVLVQGQVLGTFKTTGNLTIAEQAKIEADIQASNVLVSGEVIGNIKCQNKIDLTPTARIQGDLEAAIISVQTGATLEGRCSTKKSEAALPPKEENKNKKK